MPPSVVISRNDHPSKKLVFLFAQEGILTLHKKENTDSFARIPKGIENKASPLIPLYPRVAVYVRVHVRGRRRRLERRRIRKSAGCFL